MLVMDFIFTNLLLGIGLAMDAFSVSVANGLHESDMKLRRSLMIAGVFGGFQMLMPLIGWGMVNVVLGIFGRVQIFLPWISFIILSIIGTKMLIEGIHAQGSEEEDIVPLRKRELLVQGIATSIDALSAGFAISGYGAVSAVSGSFIIGAVTFVICLAGLKIGRAIGGKISGKASVFGGLILILIGVKLLVEVFI